MKKIAIFLILFLLFLMTSCADFAQIGGSFSHDYDIAKTKLSIYVDLSDDNWIQNKYNSSNLFKYKGYIYFKDNVRFYKIDGTSSKLLWKASSPATFTIENNEIYCVYEKLSNGYSITSRAYKFSPETDRVDYDDDGHSLITKLNKYNRLLPNISDLDVLVMKDHWYNDCYYYALNYEEDNRIDIWEYNTFSDEYRMIKSCEAIYQNIYLFHTKDNITICSVFDDEIENAKMKMKVETISRYDLSTSVQPKEIEYYIGYQPKETYPAGVIKVFTSFFDEKLYVFSLRAKEDTIDVNIYDIKTGEVSISNYKYELKDELYIDEEQFAFRIFDDKYFYILESFKVSRIDRTTGLVELVYEVVE